MTRPAARQAGLMQARRFVDLWPLVTRSAFAALVTRSAFAALVACNASAALAATATDGRCEGTEIRVVGATAADAADVCQGARAALAFLQDQGLTQAPMLTIEVGPRLPEVVGHGAAGCFLQERNRAHVLTYAAFRARRTWFGVPITRELYRSLSTHETAHAIAACSFTAVQPSIQAKEYVAYVTMFATMPSALRNRALKSLPGSGFTDIGRVSSFVYQFDPMRFGAEAYRHFVGLHDRAAFLRDVMAGQVLAE